MYPTCSFMKPFIESVEKLISNSHCDNLLDTIVVRYSSSFINAQIQTFVFIPDLKEKLSPYNNISEKLLF